MTILNASHLLKSNCSTYLQLLFDAKWLYALIILVKLVLVVVLIVTVLVV